MNIKQFKNSIVKEELSRFGTDCKFLYKTYLSILLNGGKLRQTCYIAVCKQINGYMLSLGDGDYCDYFKFTDKLAHNEMISFFNKIIREKKWEVDEIHVKYFDKNGDEIFDELPDMKKVSSMVESNIKTTYFMDKKIDIKEIR